MSSIKREKIENKFRSISLVMDCIKDRIITLKKENADKSFNRSDSNDSSISSNKKSSFKKPPKLSRNRNFERKENKNKTVMFDFEPIKRKRDIPMLGDVGRFQSMVKQSPKFHQLQLITKTETTISNNEPQMNEEHVIDNDEFNKIIKRKSVAFRNPKDIVTQMKRGTSVMIPNIYDQIVKESFSEEIDPDNYDLEDLKFKPRSESNGDGDLDKELKKLRNRKSHRSNISKYSEVVASLKKSIQEVKEIIVKQNILDSKAQADRKFTFQNRNSYIDEESPTRANGTRSVLYKFNNLKSSVTNANIGKFNRLNSSTQSGSINNYKIDCTINHFQVLSNGRDADKRLSLNKSENFEIKVDRNTNHQSANSIGKSSRVTSGNKIFKVSSQPEDSIFQSNGKTISNAKKQSLQIELNKPFESIAENDWMENCTQANKEDLLEDQYKEASCEDDKNTEEPIKIEKGKKASTKRIESKKVTKNLSRKESNKDKSNSKNLKSSNLDARLSLAGRITLSKTKLSDLDKQLSFKRSRLTEFNRQPRKSVIELPVRDRLSLLAKKDSPLKLKNDFSAQTMLSSRSLKRIHLKDSSKELVIKQVNNENDRSYNASRNQPLIEQISGEDSSKDEFDHNPLALANDDSDKECEVQISQMEICSSDNFDNNNQEVPLISSKSSNYASQDLLEMVEVSQPIRSSIKPNDISKIQSSKFSGLLPKNTDNKKTLKQVKMLNYCKSDLHLFEENTLSTLENEDYQGTKSKNLKKYIPSKRKHK